jgi:hypothetical protein
VIEGKIRPFTAGVDSAAAALTPFQHLHFMPETVELTRGCQAGKSSANDQDPLLPSGCRPHGTGRSLIGRCRSSEHALQLQKKRPAVHHSGGWTEWGAHRTPPVVAGLNGASG